MRTSRLQEAIRAWAPRAWGGQKALASRLGVTESTVSKWANGLMPSAYHRKRIARVLGKKEKQLWP